MSGFVQPVTGQLGSTFLAIPHPSGTSPLCQTVFMHLADCLPWGVDRTVGIVVDTAARFLLTHRSAAQHSPYLSSLAAKCVVQGVCLTASDCV